MANNLKIFNTKSDYDLYMSTNQTVYPNVVYITETDEVIYNDNDLYPRMTFNAAGTPTLFSLNMVDKIYMPKGTVSQFYVSRCFSGLNFNELHLPSSTMSIQDDFCANGRQTWYLYVHRVDPPTISANAFASCSYMPTKIYIPRGQFGKYAAATNWKNWVSIIEEMD